MQQLDKIITVAWLLSGIYIIILFLIGADLWSGVRKAKARGEIRTSYSYRKTIHKISNYYNVLLALTIVDCLQIGSIWSLDSYYGYNIPIFPLITLIGAVGISLIEIKSIYEKAEDKVKVEYETIGLLVTQLLRHKQKPKEVVKAIVEFMDKHTTETGGAKQEKSEIDHI